MVIGDIFLTFALDTDSGCSSESFNEAVLTSTHNLYF